MSEPPPWNDFFTADEPSPLLEALSAQEEMILVRKGDYKQLCLEAELGRLLLKMPELSCLIRNLDKPDSQSWCLRQFDGQRLVRDVSGRSPEEVMKQ